MSTLNEITELKNQGKKGSDCIQVVQKIFLLFLVQPTICAFFFCCERDLDDDDYTEEEDEEEAEKARIVPSASSSLSGD